MTLQELNQKLSFQLKGYILQQRHIRTGALYRSVVFDCQLVGGELIIRFDSMFYIKYLELGQFVPDFFQLSTTNDTISQFVIENAVQVL